MRETITIFFFANNNHLSNVKTLQSIYKQDHPYINLIICNDCTYGFQNERLLNNFEAGRPSNIQQVHFHENVYPMGEYASQAQFWSRIDSEYFLTVHSGEYFTAPSALSSCINTLKIDKSLDAAVVGSELWSNDFKRKLSTHIYSDHSDIRTVLSAEYSSDFLHTVRDCMVIYQLSTLRSIQIDADDWHSQISQQLLAHMIQQGCRVTALPTILCRYSESSIQDVTIPAPTKFGSDTLQNIKNTLKESAERQEPLCPKAPAQPAKSQKKNIHLLLFRLSYFSKIKIYLMAALMLYIAAALFLHLETVMFSAIGFTFLIGAFFATLWTIAMVFCKLYYKRNPQRLVSY